MKKLITASAIAATLFITQFAQAKESPAFYLSAKAGLSLMEFEDLNVYSAVGGDLNYQYDRSVDDNVYGGGLGIGYDFSNNLRAEVEYFYRSKFEYDKRTNDNVADARWDITVQTLLAQLFYDFNNSTALTPYVFAGAGFAFHKAEVNAQMVVVPFWTYYGSNGSTEFAWDVGVGTSYAVTEHIDLDFMYRYISLGETKLHFNQVEDLDQAGATLDMTASELLLSLRYSF